MPVTAEGVRPAALWVGGAVAAVAVFLVGIVGAVMTKGYNDDLCFSSRVDHPVGFDSVKIASSYMSRSVRCTYQFSNGSTQTVSYEVGSYTYWFFMTIAFGGPWLCLGAVVVILIGRHDARRASGTDPPG